jgi:hypothetical protein
LFVVDRSPTDEFFVSIPTRKVFQLSPLLASYFGGHYVTQYFVTTDDVHLSSIIQSIQAMIVEEEPYFERRQACKKG